jgi:serine/threonine-protein kinase
MTDAVERVLARARRRIGTTLRGKYRLDSVLGAGGMGVVYRATHRNRAEFAVKMLLGDLSIDEVTRARFLREGYAANSVKHPGVVMVVDDDVSEDGAAFLVMELLSGVSVEDLIERSGGALPIAVVAMIGWQLLDVLAAAHAAGVVHRDIKPANLFLTTQGTLKVLDFGLARVRDGTSPGIHATHAGSAFGTPAFMSSEQALGKTHELDHRTDIWSAGATMFTALTGQIVHDAPTPEQVMIRAATQPARPVATVMPSIPAPLAAVIDTALAFASGDRWGSAAEMRDALGEAFHASFGRALPPPAELATQAPQRAPPATHSAPTTQWTRDSTTMVVAAESAERSPRAAHLPLLIAIVAGVLVAALGGLVFLRLLAARPPPVAVVESPPQVAATRPLDSPPATIEPVPIPTAAALPISSVAASAPLATQAHRTSARPPAAKTSAARESNNPACTPAYTLDGEGNKHFKPECFPQ